MSIDDMASAPLSARQYRTGTGGVAGGDASAGHPHDNSSFDASGSGISSFDASGFDAADWDDPFLAVSPAEAASYWDCLTADDLPAHTRDSQAGWDGVDDEPPLPAWISDAQDANDHASLHRAANTDLDAAGVAAANALRTLGAVDPAVLAEKGYAGALLDGIAAAHRIVGFAQALQQRWIAAFARPGVAMPLAATAELMADRLAEKFGIDALMDDMDQAGGEFRDTEPAATKPATANFGADKCDAADPGVAAPEACADSSLRSVLRSAWRRELANTAAQLASAEIGCALHLSPITARTRVETALAMVDDLPATLAAQQRGAIDSFRAAIIADRTRVLTSEQRRTVEQRVLPAAVDRTPAELRRVVDRETIAVDPDAAARRAAEAKKGRGVSVLADDDDMALFRALLSAPDAILAHGVLDTIATSVRAAGGADGRGASQLRADAFVDLFHSLATTGHAHITSQPHPEPSPCPHTAGNHAHSATAPNHATSDSHTPERSNVPADSHTPEGSGSGSVAGRTPGLGKGKSLGMTAGIHRPVALNVYIDVATLAGHDNGPGELEGFGAITADTARALAASAETVRALIVQPSTPRTPQQPVDSRSTDHNANGTGQNANKIGRDAGRADHDARGAGPDAGGSTGREPENVRKRVCGTIVDAGRAVYRPPDATIDYVTARDRNCQFPGCRASISRCDLDHRRPFEQGGVTCPCNLDALCRTHHRLKTFTPWSAAPAADGRLTWTSPTGRNHTPSPPHLLPDPLDAQLNQPASHGDSPTTTSAPATVPAATTSATQPDDEPPPF